MPEKGLKVNGITVEVETGSNATRGVVEISVDLHEVPKNECRFIKVTGLVEVRLALVLMHLIGVKKIPFTIAEAAL